MAEWWAGITILEKAFFCVAAPATVILLLQTVMLIFGFGGDESEGMASDVSGLDSDGLDVDFDAMDVDDLGGPDGNALFDDGLRIFSIRGLIAFFTALGWSGMSALELGAPGWLSVIIAVAFGVGALLAMAKMVQGFMKLQTSGNVNLNHAIGLYGEVYIPLPASGAGLGKITLTVDGRFSEYGAICYAEEKIPTGASVRVTDVVRDGVFVVEKD